MHHNNHILTVLLIGSLLLLSACSSTPKRNIDQIVSDAITQPAKTSGDDLDISSAEFYIRAAIDNEGVVGQQYLIKAAESLYAGGEFSSYIDTSIPPGSPQAQKNHTVLIRLLAAKIALASNIPLQAIELLPQKENLTSQQRFESDTIRAQALLKTGRLIDAIRVQIGNEQITEAEDEKEAINQSIWATLSSLPSVTIENVNEPELILKGWLDLALIMRNAQMDITSLQEDILDWGTQYPLHPVSNTFIDQLLNEYILDYSKFNNIAIFLPADGKYQLAADVITNGFLSAYYESNKESIKPNIRFYDTSSENVNFDALYIQAVKDGADIIVGPLEKEIINQLVSKEAFNIPILTLNYAEETQNAPDNLFQFGLLPEDEAHHVAEFAMQQNKRNAAILVPDSDWGSH